MTIRTRAARAAGVATIAVLAVSGANMPRAEAAVDPATVIAAAKTAYSAYQLLQSGQSDLATATTKIINAINSAKAEIISHMDQLAASHGRACAKAAVADLENINNMSPDTVADFARDAKDCVYAIEDLIGTVTDKGVIDQLGFALNGVGPIALVASAKATFATTELRSTLKAGNNRLITRLYPSCTAAPLYGDAEPGGMVEVMLRCKAYNGDIGADTAFTTSPKTATYNFTLAANTATRRTSRAVAQAVISKI
jgi:hypothetical protein